MKRFYKVVTTHPTQAGTEIHLDGKTIKTPSGKRLLAPTIMLADAIAAEWSAQTNDILPDTMSLTQILTTALDRISSDRAAIQQTVLNYLDTDLICYRAAHPPGIVARQAELWDPWLNWFEDTFGYGLRTSDHLRALKQLPEAHQAVAAATAAVNDLNFTVLQLIVAVTGSLVLGLAFLQGKITAAELFTAMYAEEGYKAELYRADIHGYAPHEEKRHAEILRDLNAAEFFLNGLKNA